MKNMSRIIGEALPPLEAGYRWKILGRWIDHRSDYTALQRARKVSQDQSGPLRPQGKTSPHMLGKREQETQDR